MKNLLLLFPAMAIAQIPNGDLENWQVADMAFWPSFEAVRQIGFPNSEVHSSYMGFISHIMWSHEMAQLATPLGQACSNMVEEYGNSITHTRCHKS
jgi:uncharacterized membrane protein YccF (DUF307 family)